MYDLSSVGAQLSDEEKQLLYNIPMWVGGGDICNIGDGRWGGSANLMALGLKENNLPGHIYIFDTYKKIRPWRIEPHSIKHGVNEYLTRVEGSSLDLADKYLDKFFSFTFIDGNHSYEYCLKDIQNSMRNSKWIGIHDVFSEETPDVTKAVEDSGIKNWLLKFQLDKTVIYDSGRDSI